MSLWNAPEITQIEPVEEAVFENQVRWGGLDYLHRFFQQKKVLVSIGLLLAAGILVSLVIHFVYVAKPDLPAEELVQAFVKQLEEEDVEVTGVKVIDQWKQDSHFFYNSQYFVLEAVKKPFDTVIRIQGNVDPKTGKIINYGTYFIS